MTSGPNKALAYAARATDLVADLHFGRTSRLATERAEKLRASFKAAGYTGLVVKQSSFKMGPRGPGGWREHTVRVYRKPTSNLTLEQAQAAVAVAS